MKYSSTVTAGILILTILVLTGCNPLACRRMGRSYAHWYDVEVTQSDVDVCVADMKKDSPRCAKVTRALARCLANTDYDAALCETESDAVLENCEGFSG